MVKHMKGLALLFLTSAALAGVTTTVVNNTATFHADGKDAVTVRATAAKSAHDLCFDMAKTVPHATCTDVYGITNVPDCADVKAPHIYLTQVDIDGQKYWELPASDWPAPDYIERSWLYVHNPAWPAGMPNCWVRGWEDPNLWRANPKAEPGKVFMERIEPGMTAADVEIPNDETPGEPWDADRLARYAASCADRHLAHVFYPEDTCT